MLGLILKIAIWASLAVWLAVRVKRHPEKDIKMKKVMAEQRGAEYEARMQKFLMVNYLIGGLAMAIAPLLAFIFGIEELPLLMIAGCVVCLVYVIAEWRLTGEFSKLALVIFALWLMMTIVFLIFFFKYTNPKPATIEVSDVYITAKGTGSRAKIPLDNIVSANILSTWPAISFPTGLSTDKVNIGNFPLKNGENCKMFVCTDGGPVLEVRTVDGKLYYLNCATEKETLEMIEKVKAVTTVKVSAVLPHCKERSNPDKELHSWIASSCLLAMTQSAERKTINRRTPNETEQLIEELKLKIGEKFVNL